MSEEGLPLGIADGTQGSGFDDLPPAGLDDTNSPTAEGDLTLADPDGDALTVQLGLPGGDYYTASGALISWSVSPDGHTLTGTAGGLPAVVVTITDAGHYTVTLSQPLDHGDDGNVESELTLSVPLTVDDGATTGSGTLTVHIEDDQPVITASTQPPGVLLEVDETALGTNDSGSFAAHFNVLFGGDGPQDPLNAVDYSLGINAGATGIFDTATGQQVQLELIDGVVHGFILDGPTHVDVFTVSVDGDAEVTLDQLRAVVHEDTGGNPSDVAETLASANLVTLTAEATDADDDSASHTINIGTTLRFGDDHPFIDVSATDSALNVVLTQDG